MFVLVTGVDEDLGLFHFLSNSIFNKIVTAIYTCSRGDRLTGHHSNPDSVMGRTVNSTASDITAALLEELEKSRDAAKALSEASEEALLNLTINPDIITKRSGFP